MFTAIRRIKTEILRRKLYREPNNSPRGDKIWKKAKIMTAGTNEYSYEHVRVKTLSFLRNMISLKLQNGPLN